MDDDLIAAHRRGARADALSAPAGAGRLGPGAEGHEPQPYRRALPGPGRVASAPPGRTSPFRGDFIVGFPGRERSGLRGDPRSGARGPLRLGLLVQIFPPARHAGLGHARPGGRRGQGRAAGAPSGPARRSADRLQRKPGGPRPAGAVREARPPPRPGHRPQPLSAGRPCRGRRGPDRPDRRRRGSRRRRATALPPSWSWRPLEPRAARNSCRCRTSRPAPSPARRAVTRRSCEDAFHILLETPGGGVSIRGDAKARAAAVKAVRLIAERADAGALHRRSRRARRDRSRPDGRRGPGAAGALPVGRRGAIAPKTVAQANYLQMLQSCELVLGHRPGRHRQDLPGRRPWRGACCCAARSTG